MVEPKRIASADNPLVRQVRKLVTKSRARREAGLIVLDGPHLVETWLDRDQALSQLIVSEHGAAAPEIAALLARARCPVSLLPDSLFNTLAAVETPSGILALAPEPKAKGAPDFGADSVLLDGVQDPGNLGSILRSAAAFGYRQILLSPDCASAWSPKTLRGGMGAQLALAIHENQQLAEFLNAYRGHSYAADVGGHAELASLARSGLAPAAWVFGSEGQGLKPETLAAVSTRVRIPIAAATESLNVGAAAAICLYAFARM